MILLLLFSHFPPSHHIIFFITFQSLARFFLFSFIYWRELCFDTGDLSSVPSFQTFRDHSGAFPTPARQARAARKHDQHLNPLPKNRPTTAILLLYFKPFFSDYLYSYVYLATQNYPGSSSSRNPIPPPSPFFYRFTKLALPLMFYLAFYYGCLISL